MTTLPFLVAGYLLMGTILLFYTGVVLLRLREIHSTEKSAARNQIVGQEYVADMQGDMP